ncbi:hypothetical protein C360_01418 [Cryptococcus neoformans Bt15]|nr:hypothetical protein C360_01418 [Cryptococcus neoformans var. grubii Bt15]
MVLRPGSLRRLVLPTTRIVNRSTKHSSTNGAWAITYLEKTPTQIDGMRLLKRLPNGSSVIVKSLALIQTAIPKDRYPCGLLFLPMNFAMDWRHMKRAEGTAQRDLAWQWSRKMVCVVIHSHIA